jgi:hypothetical protein
MSPSSVERRLLNQGQIQSTQPAMINEFVDGGLSETPRLASAK